jgi:hypothetical protein
VVYRPATPADRCSVVVTAAQCTPHYDGVFVKSLASKYQDHIDKVTIFLFLDLCFIVL